MGTLSLPFAEVAPEKPVRDLSSRSSRQSTNNQPTIACEDNSVFTRKLPDGKMQLIATSPPYNPRKEYEAETSLDAYLEAQKRVISECVRLLHPQESLCWQVGSYVKDGQVIPLDAVLYPIFRDQVYSPNKLHGGN